jgi:3'(2'), 5'-bisphosphate nucleotidase
VSTPLLETLIEIAAEAAVVVQAVFETPFTVDFKGPKDPVTEADRRANDLICARLAAAFPGVPIVAEESEAESFAEFRKSQEIFFVDPVDGTNEFVERRKDFVVMIGLVQGDRATHGVMHAPALGVAWAGAVGEGATRIDATGVRSPIHVSDRKQIAEARLVGSRSHRGPRLERMLGALGVGEMIPMGSAGLKGAYVACGDAEAYVAPFYAGKRWDACAAEALVVAAGGLVTDAFGEAIDYRAESLSNDRGVVATNGVLHEALLTRIAEIRKSGI